MFKTNSEASTRNSKRRACSDSDLRPSHLGCGITGMSKFHPPDPVLDARELDLIPKLASEYEKFISPGVIARSLSKVLTKAQNGIVKITPEKLRKLASVAVDA